MEIQCRIEQGRILNSNQNIIIKEISRAIREDIKRCKYQKTVKTMKIMGDKFTKGASNKQHLLHIAESFYETLLTNESTLDSGEY